MNAPLYTTEILRLAASLGEPCELDNECGRAELRSPTCGSRVTVAVELDEDRRIRRITQQVHACAFGQASAALMERSAVGRGHEEAAQALLALSSWLSGQCDDPGDWPGLVALEPARSRRQRHGAIMLPFRTLLAALESAT